MKKMLDCADIEKTCPMCGQDISIDDVVFVGENGVQGLKRAPPPKEDAKTEKQ